MSPAETAIIELLLQRGAGKTICPSEAARQLAGLHGEWRAQMDAVHGAVDTMLEAGTIVLTWKGEPKRERRGPYRIARGPRM